MKDMLRQNTVMALTIIIAIASILGALFYRFVLSEESDPNVPGSGSTSSGIFSNEVRERDTERRIDVNSLATQLEVYYNDNGYYPSGIDIGYELSVDNFPGIDTEVLTDPIGNQVMIGSDPRDANDTGYHYLAEDCVNGECESYILGSFLEQEGAGVYTKRSLN